MLNGDGKATNYWAFFCHACEAAHERYLRDVGRRFCDGNEAVISKLPVVPPAAQGNGRRDEMVPHLRKCPFYQQTSTRGAPSRTGSSSLSHRTRQAGSASSRDLWRTRCLLCAIK